MVPELTYVIRLTLNRAGSAVSGSVTAYVDDKESYRVDPLIGPFDTWQEVLTACAESLDKQGTLW